jgi:hypothetical protein
MGFEQRASRSHLLPAYQPEQHAFQSCLCQSMARTTPPPPAVLATGTLPSARPASAPAARSQRLNAARTSQQSQQQGE